MGRSLAEILAYKGARVAIVGRRREPLEVAAEQIRASGSEVTPIVADVTLGSDVDRLSSCLMRRWGGLDFACHCAGRSMRGDVMATSPEVFREIWEVNFLSLVRVCQTFVPPLVDSRGHLVLIGSLASKFAPRYLGAYPASKFSVAALAQQLRLELGASGINVLLVCPGPIARSDSSPRYSAQSQNLPDSAQQPGGGAKVSAIAPNLLSERILRACEHRDVELIVPAKARILAVLSQVSPRLGDWLLTKMTAG